MHFCAKTVLSVFTFCLMQSSQAYKGIDNTYKQGIDIGIDNTYKQAYKVGIIIYHGLHHDLSPLLPSSSLLFY